MDSLNTRPNRPIRSISVSDGQTEQTAHPYRGRSVFGPVMPRAYDLGEAQETEQ